MTIRILADAIEIGGYRLEESSVGLKYTGTIRTSGDRIQAQSFQGAVAGYFMGGPPSPTTNTIEKFSLVSDGNSSLVGALLAATFQNAGHKSATHGYSTAGTPGFDDNIEKFPFSADGNTSDVGNLVAFNFNHSGHSSSTHGYASGGTNTPINVIQKFPFSTDANATDVGDLPTVTSKAAGINSTTHGYSAGGGGPPAPTVNNVIQKFSFATDGNGSDVGDLTFIGTLRSGISSTEHGYVSGGYVFTPPPILSTLTNVIERFPFATDSNSSDVGDLTVTAREIGRGGVSGLTHGYFGPRRQAAAPNVNYSNTIDKFAYASAANASDVGDAIESKIEYATTQI